MRYKWIIRKEVASMKQHEDKATRGYAYVESEKFFMTAARDVLPVAKLRH